jgi:hypothetical protein
VPIVNERRQAGRKKTSLPAEILLRGRTVPVRVMITYVRLGGCYIENMFTLHGRGASHDEALDCGKKMNINGIVDTCDRVFGNGIQFAEIEPSERVTLQTYLGAATD